VTWKSSIVGGDDAPAAVGDDDGDAVGGLDGEE